MLRPAATQWDERVLDMLWHASERYVGYAFNGIAADPSEPARRDKAHSELVTAIRTREPKTASEALARHLIHTEAIVLNAIDTLESGETQASSLGPATARRST